MKNLTAFVKKYKYMLVFFVIILLMCIVQPEKGYAAIEITKLNFLEMVYVIPPIFILWAIGCLGSKRDYDEIYG